RLCFAAAEIVPTDDRKTLEADPLDAEYRSAHKQTRNSFNSDYGVNEPSADKSRIQLRLQNLEADLSSALQLLRSRVGAESQRVCHVYLLFVVCGICLYTKFFYLVSYHLVSFYLFIWDAISLHF
ncbi:hypothetical protein BHM03_00047725, partial [Ensete ventricosum]